MSTEVMIVAGCQMALLEEEQGVGARFVFDAEQPKSCWGNVSQQSGGKCEKR